MLELGSGYKVTVGIHWDSKTNEYGNLTLTGYDKHTEQELLIVTPREALDLAAELVKAVATGMPRKVSEYPNTKYVHTGFECGAL